VTHPFVITGCARSGTGHAATLLTLSGVRCGHEELFEPVQLATGELRWPRSLAGDASWLAAPLVAHLPAGTVVLHQVREPLATVRSLVRTRHFELDTPYRRFAEELCPRMVAGDPLERSARYWLLWNRMVEHGARAAGLAYRRYRVEDLDAQLLGELLELLGVSALAPELLEQACARCPRDYNTRGDRSQDGALGLGDLPPGEVRDGVAALAARYGYALARPGLRA
jgi:hypothetical protein